MHAEFSLGATHMAASDSVSNTSAEPSVKLMIHMGSMAEARRTVSILAEGGTAISPLQPHPAPDDAGCGSITKDRFGYTWIITCPNPEKSR